MSPRAFSAGGALALLQDNVTTLTNAVTALGTDWDALVQQLKSLVTQGLYEQAATTLEEFLIQQALVRTYDLKVIKTAAELLHQTNGQYRISELADYCQVSVRQLEALRVALNTGSDPCPTVTAITDS